MGARVVGFSGAGFGAGTDLALTDFGAAAGFWAGLGGEFGKTWFAAGSWSGVVLVGCGASTGLTSTSGDSVPVAGGSLVSPVLILDSSGLMNDLVTAQPGRTG